MLHIILTIILFYIIFRNPNGTEAEKGFDFSGTVYSAVSDAFSNDGRYRGSINQIVLLVVDAMRLDFLANERMPFVSSLLDETYGCVYAAKVKAPTVTLPRIKVSFREP
jgi:predicted AlkP superfamily pyrophosphatase or phosphodiesterase